MEKQNIPMELVKPVMDKFNIDEIEARQRLHLLGESGILGMGHPEDPDSMRMIDDFLSMPSEESASKVLFEQTLNRCRENPEFVAQYDRLTGRNFTQALKDIDSGKITNPNNIRKHITRFGKFVKEFVFDRMVHETSNI